MLYSFPRVEVYICDSELSSTTIARCIRPYGNSSECISNENAQRLTIA